MSDMPERSHLSPVEAFGVDVRQVRRARGMTMKGLGSATGYSESYVSKVEAAKQIPSLKFAIGADRALGTTPLFEHQLQRVLEGDHPPWFRPYVELEQRAVRIQNHSLAFITGLLQTEDYALAVYRASIPRLSDEVIKSRVAARLRRQEILLGAMPPELWVVLSETCLRTVVGGPGVMARQLEHLSHVAQSLRVTIQVLPFSEGAPPYYLPFALLDFAKDPSVLHIDGPRGGRRFDDCETVGIAVQQFDRLRANALSPAGSARWIAEKAEEFRRESGHTDGLVGQVQPQRGGRGRVRRVGPRIRPVGKRGSRSGQ
ncbi:helix-turn-helix transcriptional regulator [Streptomyces uncialis]|nr:helix-turn-helix transcriptional regulator [Streptomyces uncialis]